MATIRLSTQVSKQTRVEINLGETKLGISRESQIILKAGKRTYILSVESMHYQSQKRK